MKTFNESDWLAELTALGSKTKTGDDGYRSLAEIAEMLNIGRDRVRRLLALAGKAGRLAVHREQRPSISGEARSVPVYLILPAKKGGAK